MLKLYLTPRGPIAQSPDRSWSVPVAWDDLVRSDDLSGRILSFRDSAPPVQNPAGTALLAPIRSQEVWAAGVTYMRSREARMEESKSAGGGDFYDRVYSADRPELFFKSVAHRVIGPGGKVRIRGDSKWNVPEPELTLLANPKGRIIGYTIGNDMSSRDIEGENPLYLPQAKTYDGSCALGPAVLIAESPLPASTEIRMEIHRGGQSVFTGKTSLTQLKRKPQELVDYLFRETSYPDGCYLLTGAGIVPPDGFTLDHGDEVRITIDPIGTLTNIVE